MNVAAFTKTYEGRLVLNMPRFELEEGCITAVIGANGSGKSTMAKVVSGIEASDQKKKVIPAGITVGYMPQKNYAFRMTAEKNIFLNGKDKNKAEELMEALQLAQLAKQRAKKLSGGETAKMALVRLLMGSYELLILDEPTAAMDMESTLASEKLLIQHVKETGCTVLLITHNLQQARRLADRVLFFCKGELAEAGSAEKILDDPEKEETRRFLDFYGMKAL